MRIYSGNVLLDIETKESNICATVVWDTWKRSAASLNVTFGFRRSSRILYTVAREILEPETVKGLCSKKVLLQIGHRYLRAW